MFSCHFIRKEPQSLADTDCSRRSFQVEQRLCLIMRQQKSVRSFQHIVSAPLRSQTHPLSTRCLNPAPKRQEIPKKIESHYAFSGGCAELLPPLLPPCSSGNAKFVKTANSPRGAVGVFTYTLHNQYTKRTTGKMAVMFSVPYDYNLYENWYGLGIFDKSTECNENLFDLMYDNNIVSTFSTGKASGPSLAYKKDQVTITASMSDQAKSVIKVLVKDNWS